MAAWQNQRRVVDEVKKRRHLRAEGHTYALDTDNYVPKKGGNSFVLWAMDDVEHKPVAIKFFFRPRGNARDQARFLAEIEFLRKLDHPRIIKCLAAGELRLGELPLVFYAMPRAKGSMDILLKQRSLRGDLEFTGRFFLELASALEYLHDQGKGFHRDLKEANILLDEENLPILSDFGIAHIASDFLPDAVMTGPGENLRNVLYSTPEQHHDPKQVTYKTDIASFGYLLNHWLTREPPRPNTLLPSDVLKQQDAIAIDAVIENCTARDPQLRYERMRDCLDDIRIAFSGPSKEKERLGAFGSARRKVRALSRGWPQRELVSAATLRELYLMRNRFKPDLKETDLLFSNLLIRGEGTHFDRTTPDREPGALGWYWFSSMSKEEALSRLKDQAGNRNEEVREGVARMLGVLGERAELGLLWVLTKDRNPRVAAKAIMCIGILGDEADCDRVRSLFTSTLPSNVKEAIADVLWRRGSQNDFDLLSKMMSDEDPNVSRTAVRGLAVWGLASKVRELLEKHLKKLDESSKEIQNRHRQVKSAIRRYLDNSLSDQHMRYVERSVEDQKSQLEKLTVAEARERAFAWILFTSPAYQDAGIQWLEQNEVRSTLEAIIGDRGEDLPFAVLQHLDEFLYRPPWWRDALSRFRH